jgi:hypothetical protein
MERRLSWEQDTNGLSLLLPRDAPSKYAVVFKITGEI